MGMTDKEQREVRNYSAFLLKEYGFDIPLNDPVMPALFIIHKEMELTNLIYPMSTNSEMAL